MRKSYSDLFSSVIIAWLITHLHCFNQYKATGCIRAIDLQTEETSTLLVLYALFSI